VVIFLQRKGMMKMSVSVDFDITDGKRKMGWLAPWSQTST
jgi:hypothetical protein